MWVAISAYHIPLGGMSLEKTPWHLVSSVVLWGWGAASLLSSSFQNVDQEKAQFALPSAGIRCLLPQSCPVAQEWTVVRMSWPPNKGSSASKQRISKWVVEAISLAYESASQPSPMAVWSHSTGVWRPPRPLYQELLSKRFLKQQAGPHHTH